MKQVVVLSGKGGTGKTSVTAALVERAAREEPVVLVDADADAANLGLLLDPETVEEIPFHGAKRAVVDPDLCMGCGACASACRFGAIRIGTPAVIDPVACEGCGACSLECFTLAIRMETPQSGREIRATTPYGDLLHGDLEPGQENSGKLVAALRRTALARAEMNEARWILIDGPPGIGCPAIAASTGADAALLVTEPSASALSDLGRVLGMVRHFDLPAMACLNKADLHPASAERIRRFLAAEGVPLVAEIPFTRAMGEAIDERRPASAGDDPLLRSLFTDLWHEVRCQIDPVVPACP